MTNFEYLKNCEEEELAELLAALVVNTLEEALNKSFSQKAISLEIAAIRAWLADDVVAGDYVN